MTRSIFLQIFATFVSLAASATVAAQTPDVLGEVRVHGNHTTPDADILAIAGLTVGASISDVAISEATRRLEQSGRFDDVEIRKRYRSIDNPGDILVIILVDEVTGITPDDLTPGPFKKLRSLGMWLPVLDYADGYGFTYGARITFVDALGKRSRISTPLTWGGERRAAVEVDRTFLRGPVTRIEAAAAVSRRVNPHYDIADTRREIRARAERTLTSWLRVGGGARLARVEFGGAEDSLIVPAAEITLDTRVDPAFPRNAVHATAAIERLGFDHAPTVVRWTTDVRGYVGLFGSSVLALRVVNARVNNAVPEYEQQLLGGVSTVRGFDFGYRAGDNLAALSAEIRVPVTSPLSLGRLGVKGFVDAGTVYPHEQPLSDQTFDRGAGGGVFISWAVVRMGLDVAWPVSGATHNPRVHFGLGVSF